MTDSRIVLITGGGRGIGKSAALRAAEAGHDIVLTYRSNEREAHDVAAAIGAHGRRALALPLDLAASASFGAFVDRLRGELARGGFADRLYAIVHNAGSGSYAAIGEITDAELQGQFDLHVKGPLLLTQALLPLLADGGRIIALGSRLSQRTYPGQATYAAMKGALEVLVRYLARELGPRGITANAISPGGIETDFLGGIMRDPAVQRAVIAETALGRIGRPEDIGGLIALLLAPGAGWLTGERIEVTGGHTL